MAQLRAGRKASIIRSELLDAMSSFFRNRGYLEVKTPELIPVPAQELHIDAVRCGDMYFRTSPEFHMKRLLAGGSGSIFQAGPCWRAGEKGRFHNPKFTMLEWYRVDADYMDVASETVDLLLFAADAVLGETVIEWGGHFIDLAALWDIRDVSEVFRSAVGWDPVAAYEADRFDLDLVTKVEPAFPAETPLILKDYPAEAAAFSRIRGSVAERWELYIGGIELANAYTELTDASEQELRLRKIAEQRRVLGKEVYKQDEEFLSAMRSGLPECAGVALGVDRLAMLFSGAGSIQEVCGQDSE